MSKSANGRARHTPVRAEYLCLTHRSLFNICTVEFLRRNTDRTIKITLPGPFTMLRQAKNEFYRD